VLVRGMHPAEASAGFELKEAVMELGPLPDAEPVRNNHPHYTADQMRAYAAAEVAKERERCAQWVRDNYQDHANIDSLCEAIRSAQ